MLLNRTSESAEVMLGLLEDALDRVNFGLVLLDPDMCVRFANASLTEILNLPASLLTSGLTLRSLLAHLAVKLSVSPEADLATWLDEQEASVQAGSIQPGVIAFADHRRVLFCCVACPDGTRILTYTDISAELRREACQAVARMQSELRFSSEMLEGQAAHLASLAEAAEDNAQRAEAARSLLESEIAERRQLESRLRLMATTDGLTGALNRSELLASAQVHVEMAQRFGQTLSVLMLDVDHFKAINDQYGHAGGDRALQHLVTLLRGEIRQVDLLGRLGGEEFAVVLPGTPLEAAETVAERLRVCVAESVLMVADRRIRMTISIGLADLRDSDDSVEQIIGRADDALYRAKGTGRNRVVRDRQAQAA